MNCMGESLAFHYEVDGGDFTSAGQASVKIKKNLRQLGVDAETIRRVSIAMYEGEINMVIHANGGNADVIVDDTGVTIILADKGPGIADTEKAVDTDRKLFVCGVALSLAICLTLLAVSGLFPQFYNTSAEIRALSSRLIRLIALVIPVDTVAHMCYFTIRSGGMTGVTFTFLFDSGFSWAVNVPVAWLLAHLTAMPILPLYALSSFTVIGKCVIGAVIVKRRVWVNTLSAG